MHYYAAKLLYGSPGACLGCSREAHQPPEPQQCTAAADTLVDVLTVEEMLMYTAELKRPVQEQRASKKAAVDALIDDLGLETCRNVRIGNSMNRGISGGQV